MSSIECALGNDQPSRLPIPKTPSTAIALPESIVTLHIFSSAFDLHGMVSSSRITKRAPVYAEESSPHEMTTNSSFEGLPMSATSFPRFSSLPPEIRQMIWEIAASPRIVYLEMVPGTKHTCSRVWSDTPIDGPESMGFFDLDNQPAAAQMGQGPDPPEIFRTRSIPPLFYVCKESYMVATQRIYTKSFASQYSLPETWFNFELDTLYLDWGFSYDEDDPDEIGLFFDPEDLGADIKKVQNLALYSRGNPYDEPDDEFLSQILSDFGNVRNLTMVPPRYKSDETANLVFLEFSEVVEHQQYYRYEGEPELHPIPLRELSGIHKICWGEGVLWANSELLWEQHPYSRATRLNDAPNNEMPKWKQPYLQCKPVFSMSTKFGLMERKQIFDRLRDAQRLTFTMTARGYNSLEVSVPLPTTIDDLLSLFCEARSIVIKDEHRDWVDIYLGHRRVNCNDYSGCRPTLYSLRRYYDWKQHSRLDLYFHWEGFKCSCVYNETDCHHIDMYRRTLWMEAEDWGLHDLFEGFAHMDKTGNGNIFTQ
jgi:2EXR family